MTTHDKLAMHLAMLGILVPITQARDILLDCRIALEGTERWMRSRDTHQINEGHVDILITILNTTIDVLLQFAQDHTHKNTIITPVRHITNHVSQAKSRLFTLSHVMKEESSSKEAAISEAISTKCPDDIVKALDYFDIVNAIDKTTNIHAPIDHVTSSSNPTQEIVTVRRKLRDDYRKLHQLQRKTLTTEYISQDMKTAIGDLRREIIASESHLELLVNTRHQTGQKRIFSSQQDNWLNIVTAFVTL